jgi:hypothetical protein
MMVDGSYRDSNLPKTYLSLLTDLTTYYNQTFNSLKRIDKTIEEEKELKIQLSIMSSVTPLFLRVKSVKVRLLQMVL